MSHMKWVITNSSLVFNSDSRKDKRPSVSNNPIELIVCHHVTIFTPNNFRFWISRDFQSLKMTFSNTIIIFSMFNFRLCLIFTWRWSKIITFERWWRHCMEYRHRKLLRNTTIIYQIDYVMAQINLFFRNWTFGSLYSIFIQSSIFIQCTDSRLLQRSRTYFVRRRTFQNFSFFKSGADLALGPKKSCVSYAISNYFS